MSILKVRNLSVGYPEKSVIKDCSFELKAGEVIVVLGSSGDGKTTLLKSIAGLLPRKKGEILFNNEIVRDPTEKLVPGHESIKLVNQDFDLSEYHSVAENIRLRLLQFDEDYRTERVDSLLRLTRLTTYKTKKALDLSGGQRQRLAIARALADEPDLVLLDEPFNQLDFQTKNVIAGHIKRYLKRNNIGAIMVTHNGVEAMEWADRIIYLNKGRIKRIGSPQDFYNKPASIEEAKFFGDINSVSVAGKKIYFRPSSFSTSKDPDYTVQLNVQFKNSEQLGWYWAFYFSSERRIIKLFSTEDISHLTEIFIRPIEIND